MDCGAWDDAQRTEQCMALLIEQQRVKHTNMFISVVLVGNSKEMVVQLLSVRVLVSMEHVQNQILVHVMQASMEQYVTEYVLLISGVLIADMTAIAKMELNAIHTLAHVLALLDGRVSHVISPATKVTMVTSVKTSVLVRMAQLVNLSPETALVHQVIKGKDVILNATKGGMARVVEASVLALMVAVVIMLLVYVTVLQDGRVICVV